MKQTKSNGKVRPQNGRTILYIELPHDLRVQLGAEAERENRSAKAQAEYILMKHFERQPAVVK